MQVQHSICDVTAKPKTESSGVYGVWEMLAFEKHAEQQIYDIVSRYASRLLLMSPTYRQDSNLDS